ncbi:MAG: nucleotide pyrophosphohydrolase [Candidatus Hydrogenedentes bacterium]|nr:nucleotide pyrophosphohydrolase [Candidatus Hydrogenedentota bacterium]
MIPIEELPHIHKIPKNEGEWFQALIDLARYLRTPQGCPWDRKQNSQDFLRYLRDELKEIDEAYADGDEENVAEEFGDSLFCMIASAAAAEEEGRYTLKQALEDIHTKMIRRHAHVFGDVDANDPEAVKASWAAIKEAEKEEKRRKKGK